jgi:hypothetical protein
VSKETNVKKLFSITAILLCSVAAACGQPPNPLIGNWALSMPPGAKYAAFCPTEMRFTSTTQTMINAGTPATEKVNYVAAQTAVYPTTVYVMGNSANHTTYNFSSKDKMVMDTAAGCTYQRQ